MTGEGMSAHGYALALALTRQEDAAPLPVRAAWLAFLGHLEPCPHEVREAALEAHETGHMRGGKLTPDGVRVALEAMRRAGLPPGSIAAPTAGQAVKHEP